MGLQFVRAERWATDGKRAIRTIYKDNVADSKTGKQDLYVLVLSMIETY